MPGSALTGMAAGAIGTVALNVTTYLDMAVRGRPASFLPAEAVKKMADDAGVELAGGDEEQATAQHRAQGLGALLGYVTGLGVGTAYGLVRSRVPVPRRIASVLLAVAAMAGSDVPTTMLGVTDPRKWSAQSWAADIVPHLAYGAVTAAAFDAISDGRATST